MDFETFLQLVSPALLIFSFVYAAAYVAFSSARLEKSTKVLIHGIIAPPREPEQRFISFDLLREVPDPVARYLRLALTPGQRIPHRVRISQDGEMRLKSGERAWKPFSARQYLQADPPAFVWDARLELMPVIVDARIVDHYQLGRAAMRVKLMSALPLVNQSDRPELVQGALMRFLGEAVWCPTMLLPHPGLQWEAVDGRSARAVLSDRDCTVSLLFHFNDRNEVEGVSTDERFRETGGRYVATPWNGYFRDYVDHGGMHIPTRAAAQWSLPEGDFTYWRARIRSIDYDPRPTVWE